MPKVDETRSVNNGISTSVAAVSEPMYSANEDDSL